MITYAELQAIASDPRERSDIERECLENVRNGGMLMEEDDLRIPAEEWASRLACCAERLDAFDAAVSDEEATALDPRLGPRHAAEPNSVSGHAARFPYRFVGTVFTRMPPGNYRTDAGSELAVAPNGRCTVAFDWFEEPGACVECLPDPMPDDEGYLVWSCDEHDGGKAKWERAS